VKKIGILTVIVMLMAIVTTAQAEVSAGSFTVTPFIGGYNFEGNENYQYPYLATFGLRAGYNFTKHWGAEGYFNYIPAETNVYPITNNDDVNIGGYGIEGLYHFMPESHFVPFLAVGIGGIHYQNPAGIEDRNKLSVDYGAGVKLFLPDSVAKFFMADDIALRADIRHILPLNDTYNNFLYTAGITFSFGGKKKAVAETKAEEPVAPVEAVVAPKVEESVAPKVGETVAPKAKESLQSVQEVKKEESVKPVIIEKGRQTLNVKFDFDKATIKKYYYKDIDALAKVMKQYPDLSIIIEGHTCNVGPAAYNKILSKRRAYAVKKFMIKKYGIDAKRLTTKGFGLDKPIASNATKEGRKKNRRAEAAVNYVIKK
jgi:OmpA-OmpF porin, OOP family